jgi:SAM-dependent methyltransferase
MPVIPNLAERIALRLGLFPPFLVDVVSAASLRALGVAMRLGILARLPATLDELVAHSGADRASLAALLDLLARAGYLKESGGRYLLTRSASRWLGPGGAPHYAEYWHALLFDGFDGLERAVRSGTPQPHLHDWLTRSGTWPAFNAAMAELAGQTAEAIVRASALPRDVGTLADLGGSHGLNAAAFCRAHPELRATVIDLPDALTPLRLAELGMPGRIALHPADITRDDLGGPYDAALLSQLVHYFAPDAARAVFARVRGSLVPGGRILIVDQVRGRIPLPLAGAFFSLLGLAYRVSLGGGLYSYDEMATWLRDAGFSDVRRRGIRGMPGHALIVARR